jgi:hypothetical protein
MIVAFVACLLFANAKAHSWIGAISTLDTNRIVTWVPLSTMT